MCLALMWNSWPACTVDCGLFVEDARVLALQAQLHEEAAAASDVCSFFSCSECRASITVSHDVFEQQKIWTDGASSNNQDALFRRAGSGIYYGPDHDVHLSVQV